MSTQATARAADRLRADEPAPRPGRSRGKGGPAGSLASWFDDRTGLAGPVRYLMRKVFPDHWSFMLGEVAMYSMIVALVSGVALTLWFVPSQGEVHYDGPYAPLNGIMMSEAYASALKISFEVPGGLLIRQVHHWAALFFVAAVGMHMARVFFTGAFRKPREINWVIGCALLLLSMIEGFAGYSLPDDLLSGTGLRVMEGFVESTPILGSYISYLLFGGAFPGEIIIPRLYMAHMLLVPALLIGLVTAHLALVVVHKHTQYPGPGRTNENVVGFRVMPVYAAKAGGFFFIVFGVIALISGLFTINPVWAYGPYDPSPVTAGSQPDWYMGFADGALRLLPGWLELPVGPWVLSLNLALGSIVLLPLVFVIAGAYPFVEAWVTGDKREHHLLDRPRNRPTRTAIGIAALIAYLVMFFAAGNDIMAIKLGLSINDITHVLRFLFFAGPIIGFFVTKRICLSLQRADRELALHGKESGRVVRTADGEFREYHEPINEYEMWKLVHYETPTPLELTDGKDSRGVAAPTGRHAKRRAALSRFYFKDRVPAVTPAELHEAHAHHDPAEDRALLAREDVKHDEILEDANH